jgi:hypothetical protein
MKTSKDIKNYKFYSFQAAQRSFTSLLIGFLFIGPACNDKNEINSQPNGLEQARLSESSKQEHTESKAISSTLGTLYLENFNDPARNQLAMLLSNASYKKLVFQFYKLKDGRITLVAFAGKLNGKDFNPNFQVLGVVDDAGFQDIDNAEVFLGDQKLENDAGFQMLKEAVNQGSKNDTSKNYVIFTPELKRFSPEGASVIEFSINFVPSLTDLSASIIPVGSRKLNPSPPY